MLNFDLMKSSRWRKRGLSTVITSTILLSAVAIMGVGIVNWANSNLSTHQQALEETFSANYNKINEKLFIEHVWFGTTPSNNMNITINNIGTVGLNITEITITNITSNQQYFFTYTDSGVIPDGALSINQTFVWVVDMPYEVLITTERGSQFKTQVTSP